MVKIYILCVYATMDICCCIYQQHTASRGTQTFIKQDSALAPLLYLELITHRFQLKLKKKLVVLMWTAVAKVRKTEKSAGNNVCKGTSTVIKVGVGGGDERGSRRRLNWAVSKPKKKKILRWLFRGTATITSWTMYSAVVAEKNRAQEERNKLLKMEREERVRSLVCCNNVTWKKLLFSPCL